MVRPRSFDLDDVSERLMNAFWSKGYGGTAVPDLTAASGLLRGSLYAAFETKDDMFRLALMRYLLQLRDAIVSDKTGIDGIAHMLNAVVRVTIADPERRGCLLLNAIPEAGAMPKQTRQIIDAGLGEMQGFIHRRLVEAQEATKQVADLDRLTALTFAASVSIRVLGRAGQDRRLLQNIADGAIDALRCALDKPVPKNKRRKLK